MRLTLKAFKAYLSDPANANVRFEPRNECLCPLATFISSTHPNIDYVRVMGNRTTWRTYGGRQWRSRINPIWAKRFINRFDLLNQEATGPREALWALTQ